jgi:hypothetical protein
MSWNIAGVGKDKRDAKDELAIRAGTTVPAPVVDCICSLIDALPDSIDGHRTISFASYGHFAHEDNPGTSNLNIAVQYVADVADRAA